MCGGSPYLLQLYADAAWRVANPDSGTTIGACEVAGGVSTAERTLWDGQYRGRWNRATPAERELLTVIAHSLDERGVASTSDISARLGRSTPSLSRARAGLIDKGLIEAIGYGQLAFTVPGFERFVRAITDATAPGSPPGRHRAPPVHGGGVRHSSPAIHHVGLSVGSHLIDGPR